jgi:hypothetical protein
MGLKDDGPLQQETVQDDTAHQDVGQLPLCLDDMPTRVVPSGLVLTLASPSLSANTQHMAGTLHLRLEAANQEDGAVLEEEEFQDRILGMPRHLFDFDNLTSHSAVASEHGVESPMAPSLDARS